MTLVLLPLCYEIIIVGALEEADELHMPDEWKYIQTQEIRHFYQV